MICYSYEENNLAYLLKLKIHIPFDQAIPLLGIYPIEEKKKGPVRKDTSTKMFTAVLSVVW